MERLTQSVDAGKAAAAAAGDMCDLLTQGPICVEGGKKVITADAAPKSLLGCQMPNQCPADHPAISLQQQKRLQQQRALSDAGGLPSGVTRSAKSAAAL